MSVLSRRAVMRLSVASVAAGSFSMAKAAPSLAPRPLVISHRGSSALRPEHTLASYAKAIADGADYVEPDLVPTKDGVLVARHESNIAGTTDVASRPEFASRKRTMTIDGISETGWFTTDFTLSELKTLRAKERLPTIRRHNTRYDGHFDIPTFEEIIDFVAAESAARGRVIGLIPELKNSTHFHKLGLPTEDTFLRIIDAHEYTRNAPLEVQSFEITNLRYVRQKLGTSRGNIRLMFLMGEPAQTPPDLTASGSPKSFGAWMKPDGLKELRTFVDVIGPSNTDLIPRDAKGAWLEPTTLIDDAHAQGLLVHSYTCRPENIFLPLQLRDHGAPEDRNVAGSIAEIRRYLDLGLDGFFTDDPAIGRMALDGV